MLKLIFKDYAKAYIVDSFAKSQSNGVGKTVRKCQENQGQNPFVNIGRKSMRLQETRGYPSRRQGRHGESVTGW